MAMTTNQRIMVATSRLAEYGLLDCRPQLLNLSHNGNPERAEVDSLARRYLDEARAALPVNRQGAAAVDHRLRLHMIYAGYIAYDVRAAAQGTRGAPPSAPVWALLTTALTLLLARAVNAEGRREVVDWVRKSIELLGEQ